MKKTGLLILIAAIGVQACNQDKFETTESGLEYKFIREGEGPKPEDGQILTLNMTYTDPNDSVPFNSADFGSVMPMQYNDSIFGTMGMVYEGFAMLKKGDSLVFRVPAAEFYESLQQPKPDSIKPESQYTFNVGVVDVMTEEEYRAFQMEESQRLEEAALSTDKEAIDAYLGENNIQTEQTESGLRYVITEEGSGETPEAGQTVKVNYVGKLLTGEVFDTNIESVAKENNVYTEQRPYEPMEFAYSTGAMIPGFDEGVGYIKEGGKAQIFIPSSLAYGPRGSGALIKPNTVIMFEVELVDVE